MMGMPAQEYRLSSNTWPGIYHMLASHGSSVTALGLCRPCSRQESLLMCRGISACILLLSRKDFYRRGHDIGIQVAIFIGREGLHQQVDLLLTAIKCAHYSAQLLGTVWTAITGIKHISMIVLGYCLFPSTDCFLMC